MSSKPPLSSGLVGMCAAKLRVYGLYGPIVAKVVFTWYRFSLHGLKLTVSICTVSMQSVWILASARKAPSNAYPRVPGCWCIPLSCTGGLQGNQRCWNPWSFCGGSLWNRCRRSGGCMLLASGWSDPAVISFAPDLSGKDSSFGRFRSRGNYTWKEIW